MKCKKERLNLPGWGTKMLLETFGLLNRSFWDLDPLELILYIDCTDFPFGQKVFTNAIRSTLKVITSWSPATKRHKDQKRCYHPHKTYGKASFWAHNRRIHEGFGRVTRSKLRFCVRTTIFHRKCRMFVQPKTFY